MRKPDSVKAVGVKSRALLLGAILLVATFVAAPAASDGIYGTCGGSLTSSTLSCSFPYAGPDFHVVGSGTLLYSGTLTVSVIGPLGVRLLYCNNPAPSTTPSCEARTGLLPFFGNGVRLPAGVMLTCTAEATTGATGGTFGCGSRTL